MAKYKFSVVIACAPERECEVLASLGKANYPEKRFEVIVEKGKNPSENRNRGAMRASGEIIAFIDDDAVIDLDILAKAEKFFEQHKEIDIVGGPQLTPLDDKKFAKISGYALSCIFGAWKISNRYSGNKLILDADETMITSANMFCRKTVFSRVRFNPELFPGEDPDFINKAGKAGFRVAYNPELYVFHRRRDSLKKLMKQIYSYGKTRPKKESLKETIKMPFFLVPSVFLMYLIFLAIYFTIKKVQFGGILDFIVITPLVIYIIINLSFSLTRAISNRDAIAFFMLPAIYLMIHLSYGAGFILASLNKLFAKNEKHTVN